MTVSVRSASDHINEARGMLLTLLQENDRADGFSTAEWSDQVFEATQCLKKAQQHLDNAELY